MATVPHDLDNLKARCAEILEWQKTGILTGDALRTYAQRNGWCEDMSTALHIAERATLADAARVLLGMEPNG